MHSECILVRFLQHLAHKPVINEYYSKSFNKHWISGGLQHLFDIVLVKEEKNKNT